MSFHLYSGLQQVRLQNNAKINLFYYPTFISTSYNKNISIKFAANNGMLMQFDSNIVSKKQLTFCSLEWISKFQTECEILFARTKECNGECAATIKVMDYQLNSLNSKNSCLRIQIVSVAKFDSTGHDVSGASHSDELEDSLKLHDCDSVNGKKSSREADESHKLCFSCKDKQIFFRVFCFLCLFSRFLDATHKKHKINILNMLIGYLSLVKHKMTLKIVGCCFFYFSIWIFQAFSHT